MSTLRRFVVLISLAIPFGAHAQMIANGGFEDSVAFLNHWNLAGVATASADLVDSTNRASVNIPTGTSIWQSFDGIEGSGVFELYIKPLSLGTEATNRIRLQTASGDDLLNLRFDHLGHIQAFAGGAWSNLPTSGEGSVSLNRTSRICISLNDLHTTGRSFEVQWSDFSFGNPSGRLDLNHTSGLLTTFAGAPVGSAFDQIRFESGNQSSLRVDGIAAVPEPGTLAALSAGLLAVIRRRAQR